MIGYEKSLKCPRMNWTMGCMMQMQHYEFQCM